ncbi:MAG TPA: UDP-N-acetylmuramate--L-alanine ligase [Longimicrobiales bacterium]|nr:UDP-N-acetylmuramate--L-alanine ligase [Longimicrobiales bacterium]
MSARNRQRADQHPDLRALAQKGPIHFVGICGAGMSALAEVILHDGGRVTGCDMQLTQVAERLRGLGAEIWQGHDAAHVENAVAVVTTAAVGPENPELATAHSLGIPVVKRAQALGNIVNQGTVIAIAGTHGKTTTTAMATEILVAAELGPTAFVGGYMPTWNGGLRMGDTDLFVVEADEYDRSFLTLKPTVAVVTTLEADHLDTYGSLEGVREAFDSFLALVPRHGMIALCADDEGARTLAKKHAAQVVTYGVDSKRARFRATKVEMRGRGSRFVVTDRGDECGEVNLGVAGVHNVRNALGAMVAALHVDAPFSAVQSALARFHGVGRRFQELARAGNIIIIDDYAHHPTEVNATIAAARAAYAGHRLVAVFQPHLYSRTRDFAQQFGKALAAADVAWVTNIYAAREQPLPGVSSELIVKSVSGVKLFDGELAELPAALRPHLKANDVVIFMGAGNIDDAAHALVTQLAGAA